MKNRSATAVFIEDVCVCKRDAGCFFLKFPVKFFHWPGLCLKGSMKVAAKEEDRKALDYFTSQITPVQTLRACAVLQLRHAFMLVGFAAVAMALVRFLLAD